MIEAILEFCQKEPLLAFLWPCLLIGVGIGLYSWEEETRNGPARLKAELLEMQEEIKREQRKKENTK